MYFNNRNNPRVYGYGCSFLGCFIGLMFLFFIIQGSFYIFFEYFWLIILLSLIIWVFRKFIRPNNKRNPNNKTRNQKQDWHRDFESRDNTSYHNFDRDFEEVDEDEENEEDDEFKDF
ncbi:MAG TPA: hypothetical protein VK042_05840 [Atopostipes sp.]|nr:hypothetical protein [Atopostipes sp.]